MLDIGLIREKPEWVKEQIQKLGDTPAIARIDEILKLDSRRRELIRVREDLQKQRNDLNKQFGFLRGNKTLPDFKKILQVHFATIRLQQQNYEEALAILSGAKAEEEDEGTLPPGLNVNAAFDKLSEALGKIGDHSEKLNAEIKQVDTQLEEHMLWLPNLPHESTPFGVSDAENKAWQPEGQFFQFDFTPRPHWELGPELGIIDFERGVRLSGSRFFVLQGWGARLQRALISFFLDMARSKDFVELYIPYLVQAEMLVGASQFPKFTDVVYHDDESDLYLLPTAEVAITNMHRDEILNEADLPKYYVAHSPCFRREKAAAGRDTRGIKRVHQFEKVEMYKFTTPETSYAELESLAEAASDICRALRIPFRRLEIVTGDLGFSATKKYDLEMFAPGCDEWLEVSSCSNVETFQARRAQIKYYPEGSKKAQFVHTLNGSGLATPRVIIAILENYQQRDGSVIIPEVLRPYLGGAEVITKV